MVGTRGAGSWRLQAARIRHFWFHRPVDRVAHLDRKLMDAVRHLARNGEHGRLDSALWS